MLENHTQLRKAEETLKSLQDALEAISAPILCGMPEISKTIACTKASISYLESKIDAYKEANSCDPEYILEIELFNGATVKHFLYCLLSTLWQQGEGFNSKRPFGTSGWQYMVILKLMDQGVCENEQHAEEYVSGLIDYIFGYLKNEN